MKKKALEFIKEFNTRLADIDYNIDLLYINNGISEGILLPDNCIWDDDNDNSEYIRKASLSRILKIVDSYKEVANEMFCDEISAWEKEIKGQLNSKFEYAKMKLKRTAILRYELIISGKYNEDFMEDFLDVVKEDFQYMFSGCTLDYEF